MVSGVGNDGDVLPVFLFIERSSVQQEPPGRVRGAGLDGRRRAVAERLVRADVVVVVAPVCDDDARVVETRTASTGDGMERAIGLEASLVAMRPARDVRAAASQWVGGCLSRMASPARST